uniref:Uncharacterized protein n=1 Tax=Rhizophora mucronata TaxID=61149 RepID=A0A2P2P558_RHIMU
MTLSHFKKLPIVMSSKIAQKGFCSYILCLTKTLGYTASPAVAGQNQPHLLTDS